MKVEHKGGVIHLKNVHTPDKCSGRSCVIHNPLTPNMDRVLVWRDDRGFFEEICEHGVGHPTPEDIEYRVSTGWGVLVHGCCGCCWHD